MLENKNLRLKAPKVLWDQVDECVLKKIVCEGFMMENDGK